MPTGVDRLDDVLCLPVAVRNGLLGHGHDTPVDVGSLDGTVVPLRMPERGGTILRTITVVEKRHGPHDPNVRRLTLEPGGVRIGGVGLVPDAPVLPGPD